MLTKLVAPEDIREMHLDNRQADSLQCIQNCDRRVGICPSINDDAFGLPPGLLHPVDDFTLDIRLPEIDREPVPCRRVLGADTQVVERLAAIDFGLADAEHVEIRSVKNVNEGGHVRRPLRQQAEARCRL